MGVYLLRANIRFSVMLRYLPVDASLFMRIVRTLKMRDLIEDNELPSGKRQYVLKRAA